MRDVILLLKEFFISSAIHLYFGNARDRDYDFKINSLRHSNSSFSYLPFHSYRTHGKCLDNKWPSEGQRHLKTTRQQNISNTSSSSWTNSSEHPQNTQQENLRQNSIRGDRTTWQETFIICEYWPSEKHWLVLTRQHNVCLPGSHRIHLRPLCLCLLGVSTFYVFFLSKFTSVHNNGHNDFHLNVWVCILLCMCIWWLQIQILYNFSNIEPCDILRIFWSVFSRGKEFWEYSG